MELSVRDIHNHLLPGVDDGFKHASDSLTAIRRMAEHGVREFVFTPHMNPDVYAHTDESVFRDVYESFKAQIPAGLGIKTHLAAEYMVVRGFEKRAAHPETLLTYPDSSILVEMSFMYRSPNFESALFELGLAGLKPIVAHPERYVYMSDTLSDFDKWRDMGCRFQLNYVSLTGKYGRESVKILKYLLKNGMYDFVSTDLHSLDQLDSILESKPSLLLRGPYRHFLEQR